MGGVARGQPWRRLKRIGNKAESGPLPGDSVPLSANPDKADPVTDRASASPLQAPGSRPGGGPVPWCLAWEADGELAPQDRFDLLQTLIISEVPSTQAALVVSMESMATQQLSVVSAVGVTGLCA